MQDQGGSIHIRGAREHNLKSIDIDIPLRGITVVTGPSGSGKSSLAMSTLYAEGQRRYVETFSPYVRQFMDRMSRPDVDAVENVPPAIALGQRNSVKNSRSTVGTMTALNEYLKLIYARLAVGHDAQGHEIRPETAQSVTDRLIRDAAGEDILVCFAVKRVGSFDEMRQALEGQGYVRALYNQQVKRLDSITEGDLPDDQWLIIHDRIRVEEDQRPRLMESIEVAFQLGGDVVQISQRDHTGAWTSPLSFRSDWYPLEEPRPGLFSGNSPLGACPSCKGYGRSITYDYKRGIIPEKSLADGALKMLSSPTLSECYRDLVRSNRIVKAVRLKVAWQDLREDEREWVMKGNAGDMDVYEAAGRGLWYGIEGIFRDMEKYSHKMSVRVFLAYYRVYSICPDCHGGRLRPEALAFTIGGKTVPEVQSMPMDELLGWIDQNLLADEHEDRSLQQAVHEFRSRVVYLCEVGLGYLSASRLTRSLSGGEIERVSLTSCLGASLTETLFVLDEPTVGLHARDTDRLIGAMRRLSDRGNTLVVVEHEEAVMRAADHLIDLGPASGAAGGELVFSGNPQKITKKTASGNSQTIPFLSGKRQIAIPKKRRRAKSNLLMQGVTCHNIKGMDVSIPLGVYTCLTGVSGSGKSSLACQMLFGHVHPESLDDEAEGSIAGVKGLEHIDDILLVDQSPIVRTPRSTPAVYMGVFDDVRALFANEPAAQARGLKSGYFSFNSGEGRCPRCAGLGQEKVEMQFLSDIFVPCALCHGTRYTTQALSITLYGHNMADMLALDIKQAQQLFAGQDNTRSQRIAQKLQVLLDVGLGHLGLGQPLNTLSGGENQRLKLAKLLAEATDKKQEAGKKKLLILDEPGTGLHFCDLALLLSVFHRLVEQGHSLLVIEHNMELIKCADYIIDLGPEGGREGGLIVAEGTPEQVAESGLGYTSHYLAEALGISMKSKAPTITSHLPAQEDIIPHMISLRGARHHQLKNINVDIPHHEMTVVTGLSGSGKSTLAFDIIFAEGQKRFMDVMSPYARQFTEQMETPDIDRLTGLPPTVAIEQNRSRGGSKSTVGTVTEIWQFLRLLYAKLGQCYCPHCRVPLGRRSGEEIFSIVQQRIGAKPSSLLIAAPVVRNRKGHYADLARWAEKKKYPLMRADGILVTPAEFTPLDRYANHDIDIILADISVKGSRISMNGKECDFLTLQECVQRALEMGEGFLRLIEGKKEQLLSLRLSCPDCGESYAEPEPASFSFNSPRGWCTTCMGHGYVSSVKIKDEDKLSELEKELRYDRDREKAAAKEDTRELCPDCKGARLNAFALAVELFDQPISSLGHLSAAQARELIADWSFEGRDELIARNVLAEITQRLHFLERVGLGYLTLDRSATTLSGGETQRIRLAAQLGSELRGVLYVLDEPTIGLHPKDNERLLGTLEELKSRGNTLIVVEHDVDTMKQADRIIDLGPGAGIHGGEIIAQGDFQTLASMPESKTGLELAQQQKHPYCGPYLPVKNADYLELSGCTLNNLKNVKLRLPRARFTAITGPSGAGKTSLITGTLAPAVRSALGSKLSRDERALWKTSKGLDSVRALYQVDQSPIGKTPRSTPATYIGIFDEIRKLFAQSSDARRLGFDASRFSFNTASGNCETCKGTGMEKQEMDFLPPCSVPCETCRGARYNSRTLQVRYKGKSIADVLAMSMEEAAEFFAAQARLAEPLRLLCETGLGYLSLGQASNTLSGGEAQRIKLVAELIKGRRAALNAIKKGKALPQDLYLIEEPTIGLHPHDVNLLIGVLRRLVEMGNTVVVIEHNLQLIAEADYIIDMGPEAGDAGGSIVAQGTVKQVSRSKSSATAPFLREELKG